MLWLLLSSMGVSVLAILIVSSAPVAGAVAFGIGLALAILGLREMPAVARRGLLHDFRIEFLFAAATCIGLTLMAFGPPAPRGWRGYLGVLWLAIALGCLGMLSIKVLGIVKMAQQKR